MIKILDFFISHFWKILLSIFPFILVLVLILEGTEGVVDLYFWFKRVSYNDNGNLLTIVTVLIGIYFSLYTYLLSADSNSFIAKIQNKSEFNRFVKMINRGFVSSMILVLLSFINKELFSIFCFFISYLFFYCF